MRIIIVILLITLSSFSYAQSLESENKALKAASIAKNTAKYISVYQTPSSQNQLYTQHLAWKKEVANQPQKAENWLNYYVSTKLYLQQKDKNELSSYSKESLRQIAEEMDKKLTVPLENSFEKQLVRYYETKAYNYKQAKQYLLYAYKLNKDNELLHPEMVLLFEIENRKTERNRTLDKIKTIAPTTPLYKFTAALLATIPSGSIVFTNGEYDTYALLQASRHQNKEVKVISTSLLKNEYYRTSILKKYKLKQPVYTGGAFTNYLKNVLSFNSDKYIYISSTVSSDVSKPIAKDIYNTGFAYKYSETGLDNISTLYSNVMQLNKGKLAIEKHNLLLKNLMPAYITLHRHYKTRDAATAKKIYEKAKYLAKQVGFWSVNYEQYFK